ncbi:hypothetical protein B296_00024871, partial [Ensete ventricosum]
NRAARFPLAMEEEEREEQVMSEVHLGCPPHFSGPYVSHFTVSLPPTPNRNQRVPSTTFHDRLQFYHAFRSSDRFHVEASSKEMVSLKTHDDHSPKRKIRCYYSQSSTQFPQEDTSDEFLSLDKDGDLVLTRRKSHINRCLSFGLTIQHTITSSLLEVGLQVMSSKSRYLWASLEIEEAENATVLLAADVIYSDELTDSFFSMVEKLMSRGSQKVLHLALEKRYNFSMDELDVVVNGYSHFRGFLFDDEGPIHNRRFIVCNNTISHSHFCSFVSFLSWVADHAEHIDGLRPGFLGKQIDLAEIPQYIREYERGKDLELWKITYSRNGCR